MKFSVLQDLDRSMEAEHGPVRMFDSSATGDVRYDHEAHAIYIPASKGASELRADLLFEMHHAYDRKSGQALLDETAAKEGDLQSGAPQLLLYQRAARALSIEWLEWTRSAATHFRGEGIDRELGGGQIAHVYSDSFNDLGRGWFVFDNMLNNVVASGHAAKYASEAGSPDWVGMHILKKVRSTNPKALKIGRTERDAFLAGGRKYIKDPAESPFIRSLDLMLG